MQSISKEAKNWAASFNATSITTPPQTILDEFKDCKRQEYQRLIRSSLFGSEDLGFYPKPVEVDSCLIWYHNSSIRVGDSEVISMKPNPEDVIFDAIFFSDKLCKELGLKGTEVVVKTGTYMISKLTC